MARSDYKRHLCILCDSGPGGWISKSQFGWLIIDHRLNVFTDILARKYHLCWYRSSLLSKSLPWSHCRSVFQRDICQAAKDVGAGEEALADLFERIENFFKRLESYTEVPPTNAMTDIIVKIMVEVLNIFAIATKEVKQSRASV